MKTKRRNKPMKKLILILTIIFYIIPIHAAPYIKIPNTEIYYKVLCIGNVEYITVLSHKGGITPHLTPNGKVINCSQYIKTSNNATTKGNQ
jgi:hypothetical protein